MLIVFAASLSISPTILVVALLVAAVVILVGAILLFRNSGKKKAGNANPTAPSDWQRQQGAWGQQPAGWSANAPQQPGAWGAPASPQQQGAWGAPAQPQPPTPGAVSGAAWGGPASAQQQPGTWSAPAQQQQSAGWGNPTGAQQQPGTWGTPSSAQQQPTGWGAQQQSGWGNQAAPQGWDQPVPPEAPASDPWGQPQAAPSWGSPSNQQQAPTTFGGSGSGQSSGQEAQSPDAWAQQAGWAQSYQPPAPSAPQIQPGNTGLPPWQQPGPGVGQGQPGSGNVGQGAFGSAGAFGTEDADRTMLRKTGLQPRNLEHEHLQFTAFHPRVIPAGMWCSLLVYAYVESALEAIQADAIQFRDELGPVPGEVDAWASHPLARGTQITIVPAFQEVTFKPERVTFTWIEDWHQVKFRFEVNSRLAGATRNGEITIYAGPLIIASLKISLRFVEQNPPLSIRDSSNMAEVPAYIYKKIFTSYSHTDSTIVLLCRNIYKALGLDILIDIDNLRSGQSWNAALMRMIDTCDIFQLFWSWNSAQSHYVRQEWQYALQQNKGEGFIRPVYWEKPLVSPPGELSHLHFGYIELPRIETPPENRGYAGRLGVVRVEAGKEPGRVYEVRKDSLSIGRSHESDIFLEDLAVSRLHASIINMGNGNYALRDEGSANGTRVNGHTVNKYQPLPLNEGDKIQLGQTVLIFGMR